MSLGTNELLILVAILAVMVLTVRIAMGKGYSQALFSIFALFVPIVSLIVALLLPERQAGQATTGAHLPPQGHVVPCYWCAEPIQAAARVCKNCGRDVVRAPIPGQPPTSVAAAGWPTSGVELQTSGVQTFGAPGTATQAPQQPGGLTGWSTAHPSTPISAPNAGAGPRTAIKDRQRSVRAVGILAAVILGVLTFNVYQSNVAARQDVDEFVADVLRDAAGSDGPVDYEVTGSGRALVTYFNGSGGIEQTTVSLPFSRTFSRVSVASVTAQMQEAGGQITCTITRDGREVARASSSADYGVAACAD